MSRKKKLVSAVSLSLMCLPPLMDPAEAGGHVSFTVAPKGEEAEVIRSGLELYSLTRGWRRKNRAHVDQGGSDNNAAITQHGQNNWAGIFQRGHANSGSISQNGNNNAFGLFQWGKQSDTAVSQNGDGNVGFRFEGGW